MFLDPGVTVKEQPVCTGTPKPCSEKHPVTAHGAPTPEVCLETNQLIRKIVTLSAIRCQVSLQLYSTRILWNKIYMFWI